MEAIGLDIGHSAVKYACGTHHGMFPTAATPAVLLSVDRSATAAKNDKVSVKGREYFVGETALLHSGGVLPEGLHDDWVETEEHIALMLSGFQRGMAALGEADVGVVLGLPSRLHASQKDRLRDLAAMHLKVNVENVDVLPQPYGAFMSLALDENGAPADNGKIISDSRWGIIDIGYYTADYGLIENGLWSALGERSVPGASRMVESLTRTISADFGANLPMRSVDKVLRTRSIKLDGAVHDMAKAVDEAAAAYAEMIRDGAMVAFGAARAELDGVVVVGGAAELVQSHLKNILPNTRIVEDSRFAVAEGMRRYGLAVFAAK